MSHDHFTGYLQQDPAPVNPDPLEGSIHTPASFTEGMEAHISDPVNQTEDVPECDPAYTYRDCVGDEWEYIEGRWITGDTHAKRVAEREDGRGIPSLPAVCGPYTRILEGETSD